MDLCNIHGYRSSQAYRDCTSCSRHFPTWRGFTWLGGMASHRTSIVALLGRSWRSFEMPLKQWNMGKPCLLQVLLRGFLVLFWNVVATFFCGKTWEGIAVMPDARVDQTPCIVRHVASDSSTGSGTIKICSMQLQRIAQRLCSSLFHWTASSLQELRVAGVVWTRSAEIHVDCFGTFPTEEWDWPRHSLHLRNL